MTNPPDTAAGPPPARPRGAPLVDLLFWIFGLLSDRNAVRLGTLAGRIMHTVLRFRRTVVETQMRMALPELDAAALGRLSRAFYRHLGLLLVEILRQPTRTPEQILRQTVVHGTKNLEAALARGKGVLLLGAHYGNWEAALTAAVARDIDLKIITKEVKGPLGQYVVDRIRGTHGVKTIPRRNSIFEILRQLRRNGLVGFVLDQNVTVDEGVFVDFFGRSACTLPSLAVLAARHRTPVSPARFWRDADGITHHFKVFPEIPWEEIPGDADATIRHNTARYTKTLEDLIRLQPDQWLWLHKRWKTRPPGETKANIERSMSNIQR